MIKYLERITDIALASLMAVGVTFAIVISIVDMINQIREQI